MEHLFGRVINGEMALNEYGRIVENEWMRTADIRPNVVLDSFVVMPNHFHGILFLRGRFDSNVNVFDSNVFDSNVGAWRAMPLRHDATCHETTRCDTARPDGSNHNGARHNPARPDPTCCDGERPDGACRNAKIRQFGKPIPDSLPTIVGAFKSAVTKRINECRATPGARVWQRNYHERIIRDDVALSAIREYIANNPLKWSVDENNV